MKKLNLLGSLLIVIALSFACTGPLIKRHDQYSTLSVSGKNRSIKIIKHGLKAARKDIVELLDTSNKIGTIPNTIYFDFMIDCSGKVSCHTKLEKAPIPVYLNNFDSTFATPMFAPVNQCDSVAKVTGKLITHNGNSKLIISDSLEFVKKTEKTGSCMFYVQMPTISQVTEPMSWSSNIMNTLNSHKSELITIYNDHLKNEGDFQGMLRIKFSIDGQGQVLKADVLGNTINKISFTDTIIASAKSWLFPKTSMHGDVMQITCSFLFVY